MTPNSYANKVQYARIETPSVEISYIQRHAITGCETNSFFYRIKKISLFKEVLKKSSCLSLIEYLGKNKSLRY